MSVRVRRGFASRKIRYTSAIYWWSHMFWALIFYPMYGELLLLSESGEKNYSADFLDSLAFKVAYVCCLTLGLPIPDRTDPWSIKE